MRHLWSLRVMTPTYIHHIRTVVSPLGEELVRRMSKVKSKVKSGRNVFKYPRNICLRGLDRKVSFLKKILFLERKKKQSEFDRYY